ncbi:MAG TPA: two-component system sensor histidine kinase CreC [Burkholderiaceae bacterium]
MKIGLRILLGYFAVVGLAGWFLLNVFMEEVKPGVRDTLEDTLVDSANLLARIAAPDLKAGTLNRSALAHSLADSPPAALPALISGVRKKSLDMRITVTDDKGIVVFDSSGQDVGRDYSQWNDVYRTLHGQYGARSTRTDPDDPATSVMHVAAPIVADGRLIGVLSVAKPVITVEPFVKRSQRKILQRGGALMLASLLIGIGFSWWFSRELGKLQDYAAGVEAGRKTALPALGNNEIGTLGRALEAMRNRLEGKEYVEELMHTLAHELKSPIAAIRASAELLDEDLPQAERARFLGNILEQNRRQQQLIEKLLALVTVEKQQTIAPGSVALGRLAAQVADDFGAKLAGKRIKLDTRLDECDIPGDPLLLRQALGNLLDNAIDFSPPDSTIKIDGRTAGHRLELSVSDQGAGIPGYAEARLFERFYSLPRPDGAKSTGLGLPFVREVAALHRGSITLANLPTGGARATLELPLALPLVGD